MQDWRNPASHTGLQYPIGHTGSNARSYKKSQDLDDCSRDSGVRQPPGLMALQKTLRQWQRRRSLTDDRGGTECAALQTMGVLYPAEANLHHNWSQ